MGALINSSTNKQIEQLEKRISELESKSNNNLGMFGRSYNQIGNSNSDIIIKTKGQVKIQWGSKFIDLIKDGKINTELKFIYTVPDINSIGTKEGIYIIGDSIYLKYGKNDPINLKGDVGNTYVSFFDQTSTSDQKHQALVNIGFLYDNIESVNLENSLKNGIIYIESEQKLYTITNGVLSELQVNLPNPFTQQFIIAKNDNKQGSVLIKGKGVENSLVFESLQIYSDQNNAIINSNNNIIFNSEGYQILTLSQLKSIFETPIVVSSIQSPIVNNIEGFRLYVNNVNQSCLEVDNLIVRKSNNVSGDSSIILYPEYWLLKNNIISQTELEDDEKTLKIYLKQDNEFKVGDIIVFYKKSQITNENDDIIISYHKVICTITESKEKYILVSISENLSSEEISSLNNQFIYLIKSKECPIRIKDNNIDIIEYIQNDSDELEENIKTRIGNLSELNLKEDGIYSENAYFKQVAYINDYVLEDNDDSSKLASTEWVNKKILKYNPGFYWSKEIIDSIPIKPTFIGTTDQNFEVSEEQPYLLYTNDGQLWNIVNKYIFPDKNKIYILSTTRSVNTNTIDDSGYMWPSGFLCYCKDDGTTITNFGASNYIPTQYTSNEQITISKINTLLNDACAGIIPNKLGFNYVWSIYEWLDKSNPLNWDIEMSYSTDISLKYNDTDDWGNSSIRPGYTIWEVDKNDNIIGIPDNQKFIGNLGTIENWSNPIWQKSFLETMLCGVLNANIFHYNSTLGWDFNYSGILKSFGYEGYFTGRLGALKDPTSDDENNIEFYATSTINSINGQIISEGNTIQFSFINVTLGKELPYRFALGGYNIGDKLYSGDYRLFDVSFEKCYYKIDSYIKQDLE